MSEIANPNVTLGTIAAVTAPLFMTIGFFIWDVIWTKANGSAFALNMYKCIFASFIFLIMCLILGFTLSNDAVIDIDTNTTNPETIVVTGKAIGYLILSSLLGIVIGDLAWLHALKILGATRVLVVDTLKPFLASGLGWWILNEQVKEASFSGIALTVIGVLIVSLERERDSDNDSLSSGKQEDTTGNTNNLQQEETDDLFLHTSVDSQEEEGDLESNNTSSESPVVQIHSTHTQPSSETRNKKKPSCKSTLYGYFLAFSNIFLDTYGSLLTKQYGIGLNTWAINLIRFGFAGVFMVIVSFFTRIYYLRSSSNDDTSTNKSSWYMLPILSKMKWFKISLGVLFVTFITPALSNYALFQVSLVMVITLGSISPLYAIVIEIPFKRKKPTLRAVIGASLAVAGVIILTVV